jgi:AraC-like DNA-binding protein
MDDVYINYVEVIPGLDFYHSIYPAQKDQTDRHESDGETVDICFALSGHILISHSSGKYQKGILVLPGQYIFSFCHCGEFIYQYPATERIHLLGFSARRQLLKGMLNGLSDQVPPEMQNVINLDIAHRSQETGAQENLLGHEFYCYIQNITAPMKIILHQLLNCPYKGGMERIFYESKFFELLFHMMDRTEGKEVSPVINGSDRRRINEIKALLKDNLEDPPALADLAKKAAMSPAKLKRTFPLITGETVFGYLRKKRMEKAMDLLRQEMSITEVAYSVGYESISAFTKTFTKYYGLTPSALRKSTRAPQH